MFERYTEKARRIIFFARYEASEFGSPYIETEHLLLGVAREVPYLLADLSPGVAPEFTEKWRNTLEQLKRRPKVSTSTDLPLSNESKRVLSYAAEEAERLADRHIGAEHLVLGLLHERHSASRMLEDVGITLESAREHIGRHSYAPTSMETVDQVARSSGGMGAGSSKRAMGVPFVQFVSSGSGEHLGVVPIAAVTHLPREGDVVQLLSRPKGQNCFIVKQVRHVFGPVDKRWPYRDHELSSIVVTVAATTDTATPSGIVAT